MVDEQSPPVHLRTNKNMAVITTTCLGEEHKIIIYPEGQIQHLNHNQHDDEIMFALGAQQHGCKKAERLITAAQTVVNSQTGTQDAPWVMNTQGNYRSKNGTCGYICQYGAVNSIWHFSTIKHLAQVYNLHERTLRSYLIWYNKNVDINLCLSQANWSNYHDLPQPQLLITKEYYLAAKTLFARGNNTNIVNLRQGGIRTEWLVTLVSHLRNKNIFATEDFRSTNMIVRALTKARNVNPQKVAEYIDSGITSNYYTYTKNNIPPEIVVEYWQKNNHEESVADRIRRGETLNEILRKIR